MKKYNKKISSVIYILLSIIPSTSFAALGGLRNLIIDFGGLINITIRVIFGLAFVFFFWGMGQFILNDAGNDKTREEGKKKMLWGVIALFVMFSIYGILRAVGNLTGIQPNGSGSLQVTPGPF